MRVKQVSLHNFRNYSQTAITLPPGKTLLIGQNAQGKSNFLEAIELVGWGRSSRAGQDSELIRWGQQSMHLQVDIQRQAMEESIALSLKPSLKSVNQAVKREIKVNGVTYGSFQEVLGKLVTVVFTVQDLNLLRGGPKFRREWIDSIILRLRPGYQEMLSHYAKTVSQRNRLLKVLCEKGKVTVGDQDQLLAWDKQLAGWGARIIKQRTLLLDELLPLAVERQQHISGQKEKLEAQYLFRALPMDREGEEEKEEAGPAVWSGNLSQAEESDIAQQLLRLLRQRRSEEIARKQSLLGPHRDDIIFCLNQAEATTFASQGQQRSLVLSLKLAELQKISSSRDEPPVLLLDDVLAELDVSRQELLMSAVPAGMQTIITTTHLSGFKSQWLEGATVLTVEGGKIMPG